MHRFSLRSLLWIVPLLLGPAVPQAAKADAFFDVWDFSFSSTLGPGLGTVAGTVTGTLTLPIACAVACTNQQADEVTVTDFPVGLDSTVGGAPINFLPRQPGTFIFDNSFSVAAGEITDADFEVALLIGAELQLDFDGEGNYLFAGGGPGGVLDVYNREGLDGVTFTNTGIVVATPEPESWVILGIGLSGLAWLKYRRRPKRCQCL
jgi:hypothetical protein